VPFEVPESWEWCQVSDIFELNPKNDVPDDTQSGFIPMACVDDGFGYSHTFETRVWGEIRKGYSHFQNGDIGIAKISPCFENRKSTIFHDLPNGIGAGTTELTVLRGHCVNIEFYLYLFQTEWYIFEGTKEFKGVVGQQRVNKEIFTTLKIPLPPIEEQNRIVTEIKKLFSIIEILDDNKSGLDEAIQKAKAKILDLAIHGKLVPQDPNDEPAAELLRRINPKFTPCDNGHDTNQLPVSWCWTTLGKVGKWQSGATPSRLNKEYYGGDIPWLKTGDLNDGYIYDIPETITQKALEESSVKLNPVGSILIAMYGATIGKVGILTFPATTNQACCACVDYQGIDQMYLFYFLLSHKEEFIMLGGGGAQPNISKEKIVETLFPLPPYNEQLRIVAKIEEIFAVLDEIQKSIED